MIKLILTAIAVLMAIFLVVVIISACILSGRDADAEEYADYMQNKRKDKKE